MPWRGPEFEGELPSLGWELLEWWADFLPSPRDADKPLIFTDEQAKILVSWYSLDPLTGKFLYRRGASRRSKGWGKSPVEAAKAIAELAGPVRFDGWNAHGEPVGRPWGTADEPAAWVQIAAVSEDQTENTHSVVYELLTANEARAATDLKIDVGLTRSYLRDGNRRGKLEPVTASAGTREGQPITSAVMDETHLWTPRNGGKRLARTLRRNVGKMGGRTYETTNSFEPGEGSVAEDTHKAAERGAEGIFYDAVEAPDIDLEKATDEQMKDSLKVAYGDAWWIDLDRLVQDIRDPDAEPSDSMRFFFNWNVKGGGRAVDPKTWDSLISLAEVEPKTRIGLGFDGSISDDTTALVGCTADGHIFLVQAWERPLGERNWRVPRLAVHDAIARAFDTYDVGRMLADPPKWNTELEEWQEKYGEEVVLALDTFSERRFGPAVGRFRTALNEKSLTHDGSDLLTRHVLASTLKKCRAKDPEDDGRTMYVITKGQDGRKIDAAVAAVLAYEAAMTMPEGDGPSAYEGREMFVL